MSYVEKSWEEIEDQFICDEQRQCLVMVDMSAPQTSNTGRCLLKLLNGKGSQFADLIEMAPDLKCRQPKAGIIPLKISGQRQDVAAWLDMLSMVAPEMEKAVTAIKRAIRSSFINGDWRNRKQKRIDIILSHIDTYQPDANNKHRNVSWFNSPFETPQ